MNHALPVKRSGMTPGFPAVDAAGLEQESVPLIRQYLRVAYRWRYVIGAAIAACVLLGLIVTLLMTPKYTAISTIEIARESNKITDIGGVEREASVADQEFYQTQYGLLRSQSLAERVATQLKLVDDPAFFGTFGYSSERPAFQQANGTYPAAGRADRERAAGEILLKVTEIEPIRLSRLVQISVRSPDAALSAKVANAWSANFIQTNLERRYQATSYARNFLESRLGQLRGRLEGSERQLVAYATAQEIINLPGTSGQGDSRSGERSVISDDLTALNTALAQATADRIEAQARAGQGTAAGASTQALTNVAINGLRQRRAELAADYRRMMVQFQPEYPTAKAIAAQIEQLDQSIAREESRVSSSFAGAFREAREREQALQRRVSSLKGGVLDLQRRSIQYNIIKREADTNRQLYDGLLQRYKEIGVAGGVGVNNVAIVDAALVPNKPSSPRLLLNLLASAIVGMIVGAGLALMLEQNDEAIADPGEVERLLGLPLLGSVPRVPDGVSPSQALLDRKSELVDAHLAVQTNLEFTTAHGVPQTLAVTSTRPAEGKSTTALSLATTLARAGKKVVLVDGDMRSPSVHSLAGVSHDYGLSNYLAGASEIAPLLNPVPEFNLMVITAGPLPPNAAELLTGNRFQTLLTELLKQFDHVVVDSPPVMGLADAPLIASKVEGVVFAIESHGIRSSLVRTALGRLMSANAKVLGGVLTKFESRRAHFEYGYDYGYGYGRDHHKDAA